MYLKYIENVCCTLIKINFYLMKVYKFFLNNRMKPAWIIFNVSLTKLGSLDMPLRRFLEKFNHGDDL